MTIINNPYHIYRLIDSILDMGIIFFSAYDSKGIIEKHVLGGESLEDSLDKLSYMTRQGWILLSVDLLIEKNLVSIPLEVFDGQVFSSPIKHLQREWESLLYV